MRKLNCAIFAFFVFITSCSDEANEKSPPSPQYSQTIEESKNNGVFEFEVVAYKSNLKLDSGLKLEIKKAWVENVWQRQNHVFGKASLIKFYSFHQLILNLNIINSNQQRTNHLYYFVGSKKLDSFVHYPCKRIDTIKVPLYRDTSAFLPSKKIRKAFDSLTFIKKW